MLWLTAPRLQLRLTLCQKWAIRNRLSAERQAGGDDLEAAPYGRRAARQQQLDADQSAFLERIAESEEGHRGDAVADELVEHEGRAGEDAAQDDLEQHVQHHQRQKGGRNHRGTPGDAGHRHLKGAHGRTARPAGPGESACGLSRLCGRRRPR